MRTWVVTPAALATGGSAAARQHQHRPSPYVGLEQRRIKALSDSQVQQLRDGEGMSLALAAELNHYPGPRHVLDLAKELDPTRKQRQRTEALLRAHRSQAQALGASIIAREEELDREFARRTVTEARLRELTGEIARKATFGTCTSPRTWSSGRC